MSNEYRDLFGSDAAKSGRPRDSLVQLTHFIYLLHACSALAGLFSSALIITAFLFGWPSLLAVVLNYFKRGDEAVQRTYLASHFDWQIRTFWYALLWLVVAFLLGITLIGLPLALVVSLVAGVWVLYRIVRGWMALGNAQTIGVDNE